MNTRKTMTYDVGNPGPGLGQAQNVAGLNRLMESQPSPLDNMTPISNTDTNKYICGTL